MDDHNYNEVKEHEPCSPTNNIEEGSSIKDSTTTKIDEEGEEKKDHDHELSSLLENPNVQKTSKIVSISGVPYTSPASLLMKKVDNPRTQMVRRGSNAKLLISNIINESNVNDSLKTSSPCNFSTIISNSKCNSPTEPGNAVPTSAIFESDVGQQQHLQPASFKNPVQISSTSSSGELEQATSQHPNATVMSISIADIMKSSSSKQFTDSTPSKTVSESRSTIVSSTFKSLLETPTVSDRQVNPVSSRKFSSIHNTPTSLKQPPATPKTTTETPQTKTPKSRSAGTTARSSKSLFSIATLSGEGTPKLKKSSVKEWQSLVNISPNSTSNNSSNHKNSPLSTSLPHFDDTDSEPNSYDLKTRNRINHVKQTIHYHKLMLAKRELESKERKKLLSPFISQEIERVTKHIMEGAAYDHNELFPSTHVSGANKERIQNLLSKSLIRSTVSSSSEVLVQQSQQ